MRNIRFEESTVLCEFAKITQKQELVKNAAGQLLPDMSLGNQPDRDIEIPVASSDWKGMIMASKLFDDLRKQDLIRFIESGTATNIESIIKLITVIQIKDQALYLLIAPKLKAILEEKYKGRTINEIPKSVLALRLIDVSKLNMASTQTDLTKEGAGEKLYDVSGETAEKLIDTAHPEGSTKVDIKNTSEVIETIVDQQKKDIEVVMKKPTGKYAELLGIYMELKKSGGTEEELNKVRDIIEKTSTLDEVLEHTLMVLADQLDDLGLSKYADKVDGLLKKVASMAAQNYLTYVADKIKNIGTLAAKSFAELILRENQDMSLENAMKIVDQKAMENRNIEEFGQFRVAIDDGKAKFNSELIKERESGSPAIEFPQALSGNFQMGQERGVTYKKPGASKSKRIERFQKMYNSYLTQAGKTNIEPLDPDGLWGPKTQAAWNLFDGGDRGLELEIRKITMAPMPGKDNDIVKQDTDKAYAKVAPLAIQMLDRRKLKVSNLSPKAKNYLKDQLLINTKESARLASTKEFANQDIRTQFIVDETLKRLESIFTQEALLNLSGMK